jgi:hypothetical protein
MQHLALDSEFCSSVCGVFYCYAESRWSECHDDDCVACSERHFLIVSLSLVMLTFVMLNVIHLNVVVLNVLEPTLLFQPISKMFQYQCLKLERKIF